MALDFLTAIADIKKKWLDSLININLKEKMDICIDSKYLPPNI
jgi:hypothetical protein